MNKNLERVLSVMVVAACAFTVYAIVPLSPALKMPRPRALSQHVSYGCGGSSLAGSGTTLFYPKLKADEAMRTSLDKEMRRAGYKRTDRQGLVRYEKTTGVLLVSRASLTIRANGSVTSGVSLKKWPF